VSLWVPIRWGVVEAARASGGRRLALVAAMGALPLLVHGVSDVTLLDLARAASAAGPALLLGVAPPSGFALGDDRARGLARASGALVRSALAVAVTLAGRAALGGLRRPELLFLGAFSGSLALLASGFRVLWPWRRRLVATYAALAALGTQAFGAVLLVSMMLLAETLDVPRDVTAALGAVAAVGGCVGFVGWACRRPHQRLRPALEGAGRSDSDKRAD
jgi:hypothetical protein